MNRILPVLLLLGLIFVAVPDTSFAACSCDNLSRTEQIQEADLIFTGVATNAFPFGNRQRITFVTDEIIKGTGETKMQMTTTRISDECSYLAEKGERHLIYASRDKESFLVQSCGGSLKSPSDANIALTKALLGSSSAESPQDCPQIATAANSPNQTSCTVFASPCSVPKNWIIVARCDDSKPLAPVTFSDVPADHPYAEAITFLVQNGYAKGFDDGTFRPQKTISRAAFAKIVTSALYAEAQIQSCSQTVASVSLFADVPLDQWFAPYVCTAKLHNIVSGYPDGTFAPQKNIAFPGAAKMLAEAFDLPIGAASGEWYSPYVLALEAHGAIPPTVETLYHEMTRGEVAELVWRLSQDIKTRHSKAAADIFSASTACLPFVFESLPGVDMQRVRQTWLDWHNAERAALGLPSFVLNDHLSYTAGMWSNIAAERGYIDHKRAGQAAYYDYARITDWFRSLGITFANRSSITYSESIGWAPWRCQKSDCTDDMIANLRQSFDFYMREKNQSYRPHYNAIVSSGFRELGVNVAIDSSGSRSYVTTHYGTEITSSPMPLCK